MLERTKAGGWTMLPQAKSLPADGDSGNSCSTTRIIMVLEPRSNAMIMGLCKDGLAPSLGRGWSVPAATDAHSVAGSRSRWGLRSVSSLCQRQCYKIVGQQSWRRQLERRCGCIDRYDGENCTAKRSYLGDEQRWVWRHPLKIAGWPGEESSGLNSVLNYYAASQFCGWQNLSLKAHSTHR